MTGATATMARPKRNDIAVKVDADIIRKAKLIATKRDISLAEYLSQTLKSPVDKDYERFRRDLAAEDA